MTINEKAAYIKGLAEGVELDASTKEGKLIAALIDLVSDMADAIEELEEDVDTALDYCEELDEDLGAVEEILLDDECDCDDDDDIEYYELDCPKCNETICLDEDFFNTDDDIVCPNCGEVIELDLDDEDEDEE